MLEWKVNGMIVDNHANIPSFLTLNLSFKIALETKMLEQYPNKTIFAMLEEIFTIEREDKVLWHVPTKPLCLPSQH